MAFEFNQNWEQISEIKFKNARVDKIWMMLTETSFDRVIDSVIEIG